MLYVPHGPNQDTDTPHEDAQGADILLGQIGELHRTAASLFLKTLEDSEATIQQSRRNRHLTLNQRINVFHLRRAFQETTLMVLAAYRDQWFTVGDVGSMLEKRTLEQVAREYLQHLSSILSEQEHHDDTQRP